MSRRRPSPSLLVSLALHVVLGAALVRVLAMPGDFSTWVRLPASDREPAAERVRFVAVPQRAAPGSPTLAGRTGGDGRVPRDRPQLVAPASIPTGVPVPRGSSPAAVRDDEGGYGPLVGGGGARRGVQPSYGDPRVWPRAAEVRGPELSPTQRLDSVLATRLRRHQDSIAALAGVGPRREAGDWTGEVGGKKYGVDRKFIYLGPVRLPTAALAMLPLNAQANPIAGARERQLNAWHAEIQEQGQRAMNQQEFGTAVRRIRERKERERVESSNGGGTVAGRDGSSSSPPGGAPRR